MYSRRGKIERLHIRAAFFRLIRRFFEERDFLEVDTPLRQPVLIPEANIRPLRSEGAFLQTSPELCMKRLLAAGCERIFQICPCFRKEERGRLHAEEFMLLEWYRRDSNYLELMEDCRALICFLSKNFANNLNGGTVFGGVDVAAPNWEKLTVSEAFRRYAPITLAKALGEDIFDEMVVEYIEPHLGVTIPTFLYDYPVELASLARRKKDNPRYAERFELYIGGIEIANGFSELADSTEQRIRFAEEIAQIADIWEERAEMPNTFLEELPQMGDAAGIALGIDRLLMLACGAKSIEEVRSFSWEEL